MQLYSMFKKAVCIHQHHFRQQQQLLRSIGTPLPIKEENIFLVKGSEGKKIICAPKDLEAREMTNGGERSVSHHQTMNE